MASIKKSAYSIVRRPLITEKTALASAVDNGIVFEVHRRANKIEIKKAVEEIFDVKVKRVRTVNYQGKPKGRTFNPGRQGAWKKAYIALEEGSSIDLIEGI